MSDSQDAKNERRARQAAQALIDNATPDKIWSIDEVKRVTDAGLTLPTGVRIKAPTNAKDILNMGLGAASSPEQRTDLDAFLAQNNLTLREYNDQFQAQPFTWNDDGTVTYDPSVQVNQFGYRPASYDRVARNAALSFAALVGGAALQGAFAAPAATTAGTTLGEFALAGQGAGIGGVGTSGLGLGTAGSSIGLTPTLATAGGTTLSGGAIGAAANTLAGAAGVGALEAIPAVAQLASQLGTSVPMAERVVEAARQAIKTPGAGPVANTVAKAIKEVTGADVSPDTVATVGKIAAAGLALSGAGGGGSSGGVGTTAAQQSQAANDAMGLAREQWAWNKARSDEIWPQTKALIDQQLQIGNLNAERAKSEWETYQQLYLPAEKQYVNTMSNWDNEGRRTQRIQEAVADVNRGYDAARGTLERGLARSGVRPGGAGFTQGMSDLARAQAADTAGATNTARRQVESEGLAGLERVTNIGRGRPSTSFAADQLALQAGNSANANTNANTATTNAGLSSAQGWFNTGVGALNSAGSLQNTANTIRSNDSANVGSLLGYLFSGGFADGGLVRRSGSRAPKGYADGGLVRRAERKLAKHFGPAVNMRMSGYADGGLIRGPGTTTSDSIPATIDGQEATALSTGEAVLNAEAVQLVGEDFVERVNQAGLERRGRLGGGRVIEGEARRMA